MDTLEIYSGPTKEAIKKFAEKKNITEWDVEKYQHPQEDSLLASENPPVFVVADGVTLNYKKIIEEKMEYPDPSPAGDIARLFCQQVMDEANERYRTLSENDIAEIFASGNKRVWEYNKSYGISGIAGNPTGYFAATGAFAIIKNQKVYWATICDSYFAHFDKNMNTKSITSGSCKPYAVINGEKHMMDHIESGVSELEEGDRVFVFTDGFEHYINLSDFRNLFLKWPADISDRLEEFSQQQNEIDPEKYGHERSLIAIRVDD